MIRDLRKCRLLAAFCQLVLLATTTSALDATAPATRALLLRVWLETGGPSWVETTGELWGTSTNACEWPGVICCSEGSNGTLQYAVPVRDSAGGVVSQAVRPCPRRGELAALSLAGRNLSGWLPGEAVAALGLRALLLADNPGLRGTLPSALLVQDGLLMVDARNTSLTCDGLAGQGSSAATTTSTASSSSPAACALPSGYVFSSTGILDSGGNGIYPLGATYACSLYAYRPASSAGSGSNSAAYFASGYPSGFFQELLNGSAPDGAAAAAAALEAALPSSNASSSASGSGALLLVDPGYWHYQSCLCAKPAAATTAAEAEANAAAAAHQWRPTLSWATDGGVQATCLATDTATASGGSGKGKVSAAVFGGALAAVAVGSAALAVIATLYILARLRRRRAVRGMYGAAAAGGGRRFTSTGDHTAAAADHDDIDGDAGVGAKYRQGRGWLGFGHRGRSSVRPAGRAAATLSGLAAAAGRGNGAGSAASGGRGEAAAYAGAGGNGGRPRKGPSAEWKRANPPGCSGGGEQVTLVATDVEGSTELWEWQPDVMNHALMLHDKLMRITLATCCGYEITTEGDAFLVAFHEPRDAVRWALLLQSALLRLDWPPLLLEHPLCRPRPLVPFAEARNAHDASARAAAATPGGGGGAGAAPLLVLFKGLAVRMGIATGVPSAVREHPVTRRMQYTGSVLRLATGIAELGSGGQVLLEPLTFRGIHSCMEELDVVEAEVAELADVVRRDASIAAPYKTAIPTHLPPALAAAGGSASTHNLATLSAEPSTHGLSFLSSHRNTIAFPPAPSSSSAAAAAGAAAALAAAADGHHSHAAADPALLQLHPHPHQQHAVGPPSTCPSEDVIGGGAAEGPGGVGAMTLEPCRSVGLGTAAAGQPAAPLGTSVPLGPFWTLGHGPGPGPNSSRLRRLAETVVSGSDLARRSVALPALPAPWHVTHGAAGAGGGGGRLNRAGMTFGSVSGAVNGGHPGQRSAVSMIVRERMTSVGFVPSGSPHFPPGPPAPGLPSPLGAGHGTGSLTLGGGMAWPAHGVAWSTRPSPTGAPHGPTGRFDDSRSGTTTPESARGEAGAGAGSLAHGERGDAPYGSAMQSYMYGGGSGASASRRGSVDAQAPAPGLRMGPGPVCESMEEQEGEAAAEPGTEVRNGAGAAAGIIPATAGVHVPAGSRVLAAPGGGGANAASGCSTSGTSSGGSAVTSGQAGGLLLLQQLAASSATGSTSVRGSGHSLVGSATLGLPVLQQASASDAARSAAAAVLGGEEEEDELYRVLLEGSGGGLTAAAARRPRGAAAHANGVGVILNGSPGTSSSGANARSRPGSGGHAAGVRALHSSGGGGGPYRLPTAAAASSRHAPKSPRSAASAVQSGAFSNPPGAGASADATSAASSSGTGSHALAWAAAGHSAGFSPGQLPAHSPAAVAPAAVLATAAGSAGPRPGPSAFGSYIIYPAGSTQSAQLAPHAAAPRVLGAPAPAAAAAVAAAAAAAEPAEPAPAPAAAASGAASAPKALPSSQPDGVERTGGVGDVRGSSRDGGDGGDGSPAFGSPSLGTGGCSRMDLLLHTEQTFGEASLQATRQTIDGEGGDDASHDHGDGGDDGGGGGFIAGFFSRPLLRASRPEARVQRSAASWTSSGWPAGRAGGGGGGGLRSGGIGSAVSGSSAVGSLVDSPDFSFACSRFDLATPDAIGAASAAAAASAVAAPPSSRLLKLPSGKALLAWDRTSPAQSASQVAGVARSLEVPLARQHRSDLGPSAARDPIPGGRGRPASAHRGSREAPVSAMELARRHPAASLGSVSATVSAQQGAPERHRLASTSVAADSVALGEGSVRAGLRPAGPPSGPARQVGKTRSLTRFAGLSSEPRSAEEAHLPLTPHGPPTTKPTVARGTPGAGAEPSPYTRKHSRSSLPVSLAAAHGAAEAAAAALSPPPRSSVGPAERPTGYHQAAGRRGASEGPEAPGAGQTTGFSSSQIPVYGAGQGWKAGPPGGARVLGGLHGAPACSESQVLGLRLEEVMAPSSPCYTQRMSNGTERMPVRSSWHPDMFQGLAGGGASVFGAMPPHQMLGLSSLHGSLPYPIGAAPPAAGAVAAAAAVANSGSLGAAASHSTLTPRVLALREVLGCREPAANLAAKRARDMAEDDEAPRRACTMEAGRSPQDSREDFKHSCSDPPDAAAGAASGAADRSRRSSIGGRVRRLSLLITGGARNHSLIAAPLGPPPPSAVASAAAAGDSAPATGGDGGGGGQLYIDGGAAGAPEPRRRRPSSEQFGDFYSGASAAAAATAAAGALQENGGAAASASSVILDLSALSAAVAPHVADSSAVDGGPSYSRASSATAAVSAVAAAVGGRIRRFSVLGARFSAGSAGASNGGGGLREGSCTASGPSSSNMLRLVHRTKSKSALIKSLASRQGHAPHRLALDPHPRSASARGTTPSALRAGSGAAATPASPPAYDADAGGNGAGGGGRGTPAAAYGSVGGDGGGGAVVGGGYHPLVVIDMGVHSLAGPALDTLYGNLYDGVQVIQILPAHLKHRAAYQPPLKSQEQLAPGFLDAPGASQALLPVPPGSPPSFPRLSLLFLQPAGYSSVSAAAPEVAERAGAVFCGAVRSALRLFGAAGVYECQEYECTFMLAASGPRVAAELGLALHEWLLQADWPSDLLDEFEAGKVVLSPAGRPLLRGFRAKVGIFTGVPLLVVPHATTGRADYFGALVNRAARLMAGAKAGQVLIDRTSGLEVLREWRTMTPRPAAAPQGADAGGGNTLVSRPSVLFGGPSSATPSPPRLSPAPSVQPRRPSDAAAVAAAIDVGLHGLGSSGAAPPPLASPPRRQPTSGDAPPPPAGKVPASAPPPPPPAASPPLAVPASWLTASHPPPSPPPAATAFDAGLLVGGGPTPSGAGTETMDQGTAGGDSLALRTGAPAAIPTPDGSSTAGGVAALGAIGIHATSIPSGPSGGVGVSLPTSASALPTADASVAGGGGGAGGVAAAAAASSRRASGAAAVGNGMLAPAATTLSGRAVLEARGVQVVDMGEWKLKGLAMGQPVLALQLRRMAGQPGDALAEAEAEGGGGGKAQRVKQGSGLVDELPVLLPMPVGWAGQLEEELGAS